MSRKRQTLDDLMNNQTYKVIYNKYKLIAMTAFEWEGLPDGILERHVERELFKHGKVIFFRNPANDCLMALKCEDTGVRNIYGDPLTYRAVGLGNTWEVKAEDCVVIENNILRIPTEEFITFYAYKLAEAERTMDVNVKANKTPVIVLCDDKDVLSFKQILRQVDGNTPAVYADKRLNLDSIQALDLKTKFLCNELMDYKKSVENELLTFLGKDNTAVDKKERLVKDEANANNDIIASFFELQNEARQRGVRELLEKFGSSVTVKRRFSTIQSVESVENFVEGGEAV